MTSPEPPGNLLSRLWRPLRIWRLVVQLLAEQAILQC